MLPINRRCPVELRRPNRFQFVAFGHARLTVFLCALLVSLGLLGALASSSQDTPGRTAPVTRADGFQTGVKPFLQTYCFGCHSGNQPAAGLDLTSYSDRDSVVRDQRRWNLVLARLKAGEMPPAQARQRPTSAQVQSVTEWIEATAADEAARHPGDPGVVLARRLSNAEYDYTIRDLTGVDIRPTKEFPVDPANQAGFDNSGESLAMSPALIKKYLDATRLVASHIVFGPGGFSFAPYPVVTDEDRDKYAVNRIVDFYKRQPLDYADYFLAAWRYRHRAALRRPDATLADVARDARISPKYLDRIWAMLTAPAGDVGPMAALRVRWNALPPPVDHKEPDTLRAAASWMRDFIVGLRPRVAMTFDNLPARGIAAGSQSLVLWKDRQYAEHRTTYPGNALRLDLSDYGPSDPLVIAPATEEARARYEQSFKEFCAQFPDTFYVSERGRMFLTNPREIASDAQGHRLLSAGFHSQMGYFRDDAPLYDLVLDRDQQRQLDSLWNDLDFITLAPVRQFKQFIWFERAEPPSFMVSAQFNGFRSEDDDITSEAKITRLAEVYLAKAREVTNDVALGVVRDYFDRMNANVRALERAKAAAEPSHLDALLAFAGRAYRRPLTNAEKDDLLAFYRSLRDQHLSHEDAIRDAVVSVLMSPFFCYRIDAPSLTQNSGRAPAAQAADVEPLADYELASRLSYFLWSSMPDAELMKHAAAGDLHKPDVLAAQARRLLQDGRIRNLATEFAGNWLDVRRFEEHNAVDRERFPAFTNELREAMFEEPIRFVVDLIQRNGSVLDFLYGNYTFVNPVLARHYGMPEPPADGWVRVDEAQKYARGGLLPMSVFLTKNAPGLRTSPVKRGYWIVHRLLGEYIPAPPPDVPVLPTDETKLGDLTLRETLAQHRANPACASCHAKFDAFGLVFEGYGPVGETRTQDLAGRPVQIDATFPDGTSGNGLDGLRAFMRAKGQSKFVDNLCRQLLVYGLGRSLLLSDEPLLAEMRKNLSTRGFKFGNLVQSIVTSRQFLTKQSMPGS
jgi:mono/diheme cytochrome c family protein